MSFLGTLRGPLDRVVNEHSPLIESEFDEGRHVMTKARPMALLAALSNMLFCMPYVFADGPSMDQLSSIAAELQTIRLAYACADTAALQASYRNPARDVAFQSARARAVIQQLDELLAPEIARWHSLAANANPPPSEMRGYSHIRFFEPLATLMQDGLFSPLGVDTPSHYRSHRSKGKSRRYWVNEYFLPEVEERLEKVRQFASVAGLESLRASVQAQRAAFTLWEARRTSSSFWDRCRYHLTAPNDLAGPCRGVNQ